MDASAEDTANAEKLIEVLNMTPIIAAAKETAGEVLVANATDTDPWHQGAMLFSEAVADLAVFANETQQNQLRRKLGLPLVERADVLRFGGFDPTRSGMADRDLKALHAEIGMVRQRVGLE